jgi:hypothetical protein
VGCVCDRILSRSVGCVCWLGGPDARLSYPFWAGLLAFRLWGRSLGVFGVERKGGSRGGCGVWCDRWRVFVREEGSE